MLASKIRKTATKSVVRSQESDIANLSNTERVIRLIDQLKCAMDEAINDIRKINGNTKLLALNARIEAARSGDAGAAFGVVAQEMQDLSGQTTLVADSLSTRTQSSISELVSIITENVRGTRLVDVALSSVDLTDRNLYERTCDVRWWATDSAVIDALQNPSMEATKYASRRLGVILNAYTVYHDLVICDRNGSVIANGRPDQFSSVNADVSQSVWFQSAVHSLSGDQFGFEGPVNSSLVQGHRSLIYSCSVRKDGQPQGNILGVLGVIFRWESFANAILQNLPFDDVEKQRTTAMIIDAAGNLVASSKDMGVGYRFPIERYADLLRQPKGFRLENVDGKEYCVAQAKAPGFETYTTDWTSVLIQQI